MATKEFILQGLTARTHADVVRELFNINDIQHVIFSVAFVADDGVRQIESLLQANAANVTVLAGIRNDITSQQALLRLCNIQGIKLYTVDTGSRHVIFHPKLYLVRGKTRARLAIGSANLTLGGLNNNIEAGMLLDFDLDDSSDLKVVKEIQSLLLALPNDHPDNVTRVTVTAELDALLTDGLLVDEMASPPPRLSTSTRGASTTDTVPRIRLKTTPIQRALRRARAPRTTTPAVRLPKARAGKVTTPPPASAPASVGINLELVWQSKDLTRRDLTIPDSTGTHATGSVNLDKGLLPDDVDHRHYFRDDVFPNLNWTPTNSPTVEETYAKFELILKGVSCGVFDLRIGHTTSTTSTAYIQKNAMTRLSWGAMKAYIAKDDLIGRTLSLYRDIAYPTRFTLEID